MSNYLGTATYSPEDNKLRLYAFARLSPEDYARIRAHGFIWAPKQELFVAPMWTPERADLLEEWCGEIGDEDKTLVQRQEERAERFEEYSDKRQGDAERARKGVASIADNIPFGQPILIGHHSERHARKDAERIENGMRKAVKMWETSKYWTERAAGALAHAQYKELPQVRARRIKGLEADKRKQEKHLATAVEAHTFWAREDLTEEIVINWTNFHGGGFYLARKEGDRVDWTQKPDVWTGLTHGYPSLYAKRTVEEVIPQALALYPKVIERVTRWIDHFNNRLAYERAMLAESGGTITDQKRPEIGGACKTLWGPRGGWAKIHKVNTVTLTVRHRWSEEGRTFSKNVALDKIRDVMTKAEVEAARAAGQIFAEDERGFLLAGDGVKAPAPAPVVPVEKPDAAPFEQLKDALKAGVKVVVAPQLFPTPADLARRMVELAGVESGHRILEPSAGTGNILAELPGDTVRVAVEINSELAGRTILHQMADVHCKDFLTCNGELGKFDRIIMNPPFVNGSDVIHILKARTMLKPSGRLVAICAGGPRQEKILQPLCDSWERLPEGTFKEQGTNVNTVLLTMGAQP